MIQTSARYPTDISYEKFSGTLTLKDGSVFEIDDDIIVSNSVCLTESCCNGKFGFGALISSQLDIALFIESDNPFLLNDAKFSINRLYYDSSDVKIEDIPLGVFYVDNSSVKRARTTLTFTGYDASSKLDSLLPPETSSIITKTSPYGFVEYACSRLGIPLATTEDYAKNNLPNCGSQSLSFSWKHSSDENITYRQMVCAALQLMGAWGRINRYGQFEIRQFDTDTALFTINADNAINRSTSDFAVKITGVQGDGFLQGEDGYVYNLTGNLIEMTFGTGSQTPTRGRTLYELFASPNVTGIEAYSADITWFGDLAVEPGDCFLYTQDELVNDRNIIAMETIWKPYASCTIRAFGADSASGYISGSSSQSGTTSGSSGTSKNDLGYIAQGLLGGLRFTQMSLSAYNALSAKSSSTVYFVEDGENILLYVGNKRVSGDSGSEYFKKLTKAEYEALSSYDPEVLYYVTDGSKVEIYLGAVKLTTWNAPAESIVCVNSVGVVFGATKEEE